MGSLLPFSRAIGSCKASICFPLMTKKRNFHSKKLYHIPAENAILFLKKNPGYKNLKLK